MKSNLFQKMNIAQKFERAQTEGRLALIPFITAGFPDRELFWRHLAEIDASGADLIEIGVPFSDPVADGPVIEKASREALTRGVTLPWLLAGLKERRGQFRAALLLMGYTNPFLQYGYAALAGAAVEAGISGVIVPDLPLEEAAAFRRILSSAGLDLISLVGLNTTLERMHAYAAESTGFIYIVSTLGITGGTNRHLELVADTMRRARRAFRLPLALGFGLRTPDQLDALPEDARPDAAVFGSALIRHIEEGGRAAEFFRPWMEDRQRRS